MSQSVHAKVNENKPMMYLETIAVLLFFLNNYPAIIEILQT
jgi:hypothetical protein